MKIDIELGPDQITFRSPQGSLTLRTSVFVERDGDHYKVLGFSDTPQLGTKSVGLFNGECDMPAELPTLLEKFLAYGISFHVKGVTIFRPVVVFKNVRSLDAVLHGYQDGLLNVIADRAGARIVEFG